MYCNIEFRRKEMSGGIAIGGLESEHERFLGDILKDEGTLATLK